MLAEIPGREIVVGAATRPWMANVPFHAPPADEFAAFHEPGYVEVAWTLRSDPVGVAESINAAVPGVVQPRAKAGRTLALVDVARGLTPADLADGVHPNAVGCAKIRRLVHRPPAPARDPGRSAVGRVSRASEPGSGAATLPLTDVEPAWKTYD